MRSIGFTITLRNILKNGVSSIFNIIGLTAGFTACFFILIYHNYETGYDEFIPQKDKLFRLSYTQIQDGKTLFSRATSVYAVGPLLKDKLPEVEDYCRAGYEKCLLFRDKVKANDVDLLWTDPSFFSLFPLEMISGNPSTALKDPLSMVLSESIAKKFFNNQNPVGKILYLNEYMSFKVTGVYKDIPETSHFNFKLLLSLSTLDNLLGEYGVKDRNWYGSDWLYTYVKLRNNADTAIIQAKIDSTVNSNLPDKFSGAGIKVFFKLQELDKIHTLPHLENEFKPKADPLKLKIVVFIGIIILLITWINYANILISGFFKKSSNLKIRRFLGADRREILLELLSESLIINSIAGTLSLIISLLCLSSFGSLSGIDTVGYLSSNPGFTLFFPLAVLAITSLSALYISAWFYKIRKFPITAQPTTGKRSGKRWLTVFQLTITTILISSVVVINRQSDFISSFTKGYSEEGTVLLKAPRTLNLNKNKTRLYRSFRDKVSGINGVEAVSSAKYTIGDEVTETNRITHVRGIKIPNISFKSHMIDKDFFKVHSIRFIRGREFSDSYQKDKGKIIINESAVKALGFSSPQEALWQKVKSGGKDTLTITGVVADFNQMSLHSPVQPTLYYNNHPAIFGSYDVKLKTSNPAGVLKEIEQIWQKIYPAAPFDFRFLSQRLNSLYKSDMRYQSILLLFTSIAILISCIGLTGLVIMVTRDRRKEIGIRKVGGAGVKNIVGLLNVEFIRIFLISTIVSVPAAWLFMEEWLSNFAYRVDLTIWYFVLAGLITMIMMLAVTSIRIYRAASENPASILRQ